MPYNNKTLVAYLGVILLFVSQTSTFDSPMSLYLKIFDISDTILGISEIRIRSLFHKQKSFKVHKKITITTDTTIYYTR